MSSYKDEKTRGDIPDLDEHRQKILKEFCNWLIIKNLNSQCRPLPDPHSQ
jgi:hypothetical protein